MSSYGQSRADDSTLPPSGDICVRLAVWAMMGRWAKMKWARLPLRPSPS